MTTTKTYTIVIDETQRGIIEAAMAVYIECLTSTTDVDITEDETILRDLLRDMPTVEENTPGVIHGFCY